MRLVALAFLTCSAPAAAQPLGADCPAQPVGPPITLGYATPGGQGQGRAYAEFAAPAYGTVCSPATPHLPHDVLGGDDPAATLRGPAGDPLTGAPPPPRQGRVLVEMPPP